MKKLLILGLIPMLFVVFASSCKYESVKRCEKNVKTAEKIQKSINKAIIKEDFITAHQYLGEILLLETCVKERQEASVRDVYLAEIRYLVAKNDESSWNRAQMLPMEVPNGFETVQKELYKSLYDYAVAFDNEEIKEKAEKALAYLEGDRMIMPVSTSISGPLGEFFEVVDKEEGYKLIVDEGREEWRWKLTIEIKRIKEGKVMKGGNRNDNHDIIAVLLDEDNAAIASYRMYRWNGGDGLKVGESKLFVFYNEYNIEAGYSRTERNKILLERIKTVSKFEVTSEN